MTKSLTSTVYGLGGGIATASTGAITYSGDVAFTSGVWLGLCLLAVAYWLEVWEV